MKSKLTLFKNKNAGQQVTRKDGSVVEFNGKPMLQPLLNGKINLPEGLPAGDYEVAVYENEAKSGLKYFAGNIKPARKKPDAHNEAKQNGYQPEKSINLNDIDENGEFEDDLVPF